MLNNNSRKKEVRSQISKQLRQILIVIPLVLGVILLFHKPLIKTLNFIIITPVLSQVDKGLLNDLILLFFLSISIYCTYFLIKKNYAVSTTIFCTTVISLSIYFICRNNHIWNFTTFHTFDLIFYLDIVLVFCLEIVVVFVTNRVRTYNKKYKNRALNNEFLDDIPLDQDVNNSKDDILGYEKYATTIASKIISSDFEKSFAIGINGKWGAGKTSFVSLIKRQLLKETDIVIIDFNPWNSHSSDSIILNFFETIETVLKSFHPSISSLLVSYATKLVKLHNNNLTKGLQSISNFFNENESTQDIKLKIENAIFQIDKKIIFVIDDLDRLDKDEIIEIIRLIRNTANFYNTYFIVAYDQEYITNALRNHNSYGGRRFLEKIFQLEINLPQQSSLIYHKEFINYLKNKLAPDQQKEIEKIFFKFTSSRNKSISGLITNIRDVIRLYNSFLVNSNNLLKEVELSHLLIMEIIRLKYPDIYILLYKKRDDFYQIETYDTRRGIYYLIESNDNKSVLQDYLESEMQSLKLDQSDINMIVGLVTEMIPKKSMVGFIGHNEKYKLSIARPEIFDRYFFYNIKDNELSDADFTKSLKLPYNQLKLKIDEWVLDQKEFSVRNRLGEIRNYQSREEFEKIFLIIFYLANKESMLSGNNYLYGKKIGYWDRDFESQIYSWEINILKRLYNNDVNSLKNFMTSLFLNAKYPFKIESDFAQYFLDYYDENGFPLTKEELASINLNYLQRFIEQEDETNEDFWYLFHNCKISKWESVGGVSRKIEEGKILREAIDLAINFISTKSLDSFLKYIIAVNAESNLYTIITTPLWEYNELKQHLNNLDEDKWRYLKEFKNFYQEFEKSDFKPISFNFVDIPIKISSRINRN